MFQRIKLFFSEFRTEMKELKEIDPTLYFTLIFSCVACTVSIIVMIQSIITLIVRIAEVLG